eukprot:s2016_g6.t1
MFVSTMAFFARISDPGMGGTYMTLVNTLSNLGGMWPGTVVLKVMEGISCQHESCLVKMDGFYIMSGLSFVYGVLWYLLAGSHARRVQTIKLSDAMSSRKCDTSALTAAWLASLNGGKPIAQWSIWVTHSWICGAGDDTHAKKLGSVGVFVWKINPQQTWAVEISG